MDATFQYVDRPVQIEIGGQVFECLMVGSCARVLDRSVNTIRLWEKRGLFPRAPFRFHPRIDSVNRRLYPRQFVQALVEIGQYLGPRLDRRDFQTFHDLVHEAMDDALKPIRASEGC